MKEMNFSFQRMLNTVRLHFGAKIFFLFPNFTACCFYILLFKLSTIVELKPLFMSSQSWTQFEKSFHEYILTLNFHSSIPCFSKECTIRNDFHRMLTFFCIICRLKPSQVFFSFCWIYHLCIITHYTTMLIFDQLLYNLAHF